MARSPISVSHEASFSVSLEAGSSIARRPPPRLTLLTARHVPLILQPLLQSLPDDGLTPQNDRRDLRSHQRHTGWDRARAGITGHCVLTLCPRSAPTLHCVPPSPPRKQHRTNNLSRDITASKPTHQISRLLGASALCTKVLAILGFVPAETLHCGAASAPIKPRPHAQSIHSGLHVRRRTHSEAVPGLP